MANGVVTAGVESGLVWQWGQQRGCLDISFFEEINLIFNLILILKEGAKHIFAHAAPNTGYFAKVDCFAE